MAVKITPKQWHYFKEKFPAEVANLHSISMPMETWAIRSYAKKANKNKTKFNQNNPLESMLDWCSEMLTDNFYAECKTSGYWANGVIFYFFDEDDAVLFKLSWWQGND